MGICERFHKNDTEEFYQGGVRRNAYDSLGGSPKKDLDEWNGLIYNNDELIMGEKIVGGKDAPLATTLT